MGLIFSTFWVSVASALVPLVNAELYLGVVAARLPGFHPLFLAFVAGAGQLVGKVVWYLAAARSMETRWVRKKLEKEKWRASYDRWQERATGRPAYAGLVMLASSFAGVPPLLVMAFVAGSLRMTWWVFVVTVLVGRTLRFWLVLEGVTFLLH